MTLRNILFVLLLLASCGSQYPPAPSDRDVMELERVWQYLRVFSLYADRVPEHRGAFSFDQPHLLVESIHDTLLDHWHDTAFQIGTYVGEFAGGLHAGAWRHAQAGGTPTVQAWELTDSVAYIAITGFDSSTLSDLKNVPAEIAGCGGVIIDMINNPGGSLDICTAAVELFLPAETEYLRTSFRKNIFEVEDTGTVNRQPWITRQTGDLWEGKTVAVLINRNTASAAEILAVALADGLGDNCILVGQQSYGKAIGQYRFHLYSGAGLVLTGFRFYRITGTDYHERGIDPSLPVLPPYSTTAGFQRLIAAAGEALEAGFGERVDPLRVDAIGRAVHGSSRALSPFGRALACYTTVVPLKDLPLGHEL